ncbi:MAG: carboxypeptidase regulatory-like domain-containing protein [Planctomycetota bacterium]
MALPLLLFLYTNRGGAGDGEAGPLAGLEASMRQDAELPDTGPGATIPLEELDAVETEETASTELTDEQALASYAHRSLPGRVVIADGGRVPDDLMLSVALRRPAPALVALSDEIRNRDGPRAFELLPPKAREDDRPAGVGEQPAGEPPAGEQDAAEPGAAEAIWLPPSRLARLTRTKVEADGTFELQHVPVGGAWLVVEDDLLFPDPPTRIETDATFVEARLVRGALVEGRVLDEAGRGVAEARVSCSSRFDPWMAFDSSARMAMVEPAHADDQGRYRLVQVPAGHALRLAAAGDTDRLQPGAAEVVPLVPGEERQLDVVLLRGGVVSGRVVDTSGAPLPHVDVLVQRLDISLRDISFDDMDDNRERRSTTDERGAFRVEGLHDGSYRAALDQDGYRPVTSDSLAVRAGQEAGGVELVADEGLVLEGRVVANDDSPVPDARLVAGRKPAMFDMSGAVDRALRRSGRTDEDGHFRIAGLEEGSVRLEVRASGLLPAREEVAAGTEGLVVRMRPTVSLAGIVVSTRDSEAVTDFRITLVPTSSAFDIANPAAWEERFEGSRGNEAFQDREDGTFVVEGLKPGTYDLQVSAKGYGRTTMDALEIPEEGRRGLVVMLPPEARVVGRVVASSTGLPVDGAEVAMTQSGLMNMMIEGMLGTSPRTHTNADGRFTLAGLGPGHLALTVRHGEYRELGLPERPLAPGEHLDLGEIRLSVGSAVYGHVLDELGNPVGGVTVLVSTPTGTTMKRAPSNVDGSYRVQGLPPGTFNVMRMDFTMNMGGEGNAMDFMKDMVIRSVTLGEDDAQEVDLRVRGKGGTRIYGSVRAEDGGTTSAMVSLVPLRGGMEKMAFGTTGDDGEYELEGVQPGEYVLQVVVFADGVMGGGGQPTSPVLQEIAVAGEPEMRRDIRLPGGVLHGRVESAVDGKPIANVRVLLQRRDEGRVAVGMFAAMDGRVGEAQTRQDGTFRFQHLPAGLYEVTAGGQNVLGTGETGWSVTRVPDLSVSEDGPGFAVRVPLRPAGAVAGTLSDAAGRPLPGVGLWARDPQGRWLTTFSEIASDAAGRYEMGSLEPGAWTLAFRDGSHALTLVPDVIVRAGETTPLDVTLPPGVSLRLAAGDVTPWSLDILLIGPDGPIPTELVALTELLVMADEDGMFVVGTFLPGPYQLRVTADGALLHDGPIVLPAGASQHVVSLGTP